jgi:hypothetical protein
LVFFNRDENKLPRFCNSDIIAFAILLPRYFDVCSRGRHRHRQTTGGREREKDNAGRVANATLETLRAVAFSHVGASEFAGADG